MTRQQLKEKAEQLWRNTNPAAIDAFYSDEKANFIDAFLAGFDFAMDNVENQYEEESDGDSFGQ